VTTAAMRRGIECEPRAAKAYSQTEDNQVNLYPSGVVVNFWTPCIVTSLDRKVYKPTRDPAFGLLEIKYPVSSVLEASYLTKN